MTSPDGAAAIPRARASDPLPSGAARLETLSRRADFLRAAKGRRAGLPSLGLQAVRRGDGGETIRVGYTCSRKVGNAVARNRAKRRLREVARRVLPRCGRAGWDYVLVGRAGSTAERDFDAMAADLASGLKSIHRRRE